MCIGKYQGRGGRKSLSSGCDRRWKTYLAAFDSKDYERVLFVAHREEILKQAAQSFKNVRNSDDYGFLTEKVNVRINL